MNDTSAALAVLTGLALRLLIPMAITALIVVVLGRLDRRWRGEGTAAELKVAKPECWKTQKCSPAKRKDCAAYNSSLPCWQVFRLRNGYLDQKCLGCPVLSNAPAPLYS